MLRGPGVHADLEIFTRWRNHAKPPMAKQAGKTSFPWQWNFTQYWLWPRLQHQSFFFVDLKKGQFPKQDAQRPTVKNMDRDTMEKINEIDERTIFSTLFHFFPLFSTFFPRFSSSMKIISSRFLYQPSFLPRYQPCIQLEAPAWQS